MNDRLQWKFPEALTQHGVRGSHAGMQAVEEHGCVWLVEQGALDVFLVPVSGGEFAGGRKHLFTLRAGQSLALPCIAAGDARRTLRLAVMPAADAQFRVIGRNDLHAALANAPAEEVVTILEQWLDVIDDALAGGLVNPPPQSGLKAQAGADLTCGEQAVIAEPEGAGLWLELTSGQADYFARAAQPEATLLPLPPHAWVTLSANSVLRVRATDDCCENLSHALMLDAVLSLLCTLADEAVLQFQQGELDELSRLKLRDEKSGRVMADALDSFVSVFSRHDSDRLNLDSSDKVFNACKIIGAYQSITFRAAPPGSRTTKHGSTLRALCYASGLRMRAVVLKGPWWKQDNGPLLAYVESDGRPYALLPRTGGGYDAVEPESGKKTIVDAEFADALSAFSYMFYGGLPLKKLAMADILQFIARGLQRELAMVAGLALLTTLLGLAIPVASGYLFDNVFPAADRNQMLQIVLILFVAGAVTLLLEAARALAMLRIEGKASSNLQAAVWDRVLNLPTPFFRNYSAGDLANRINGINDIREALSGTVISSIINSVFSILTVFLLFYYSVRLALVALLLVGFAILINLAIGYFSLKATRALAKMSGKVAGMVYEYLNGIAKLRITGAEPRAFANWATQFGAQRRISLRAGALANLNAVFTSAFPLFANAVIFASIAMLATQTQTESEHFTTGDFIAFSSAWTIFVSAALSLVRSGLDFLNISSTFDRTRPILETEPEVDPAKPHPGTLSGAIEISKLCFSYAPDLPPVLDDISISIRPGEFVALVGASGSGKSTLLRLLLGFEQPSQGGIYYDGHDLAEVDIREIRRQLGVVLQGGRLMFGDIYRNIIGSNYLPLEDAWEAARAAGLEDDIKAMPMGMHTAVSEGGSTLSGGQRQRLLIARAIVNKPRIIFFDEATSALDNRSQAIVSASLEALKATRVVIAHRLSTIMNADCIYVLDKGKVIQRGSFEQLMQEEGLFAELARRQLA